MLFTFNQQLPSEFRGDRLGAQLSWQVRDSPVLFPLSDHVEVLSHTVIDSPGCHAATGLPPQEDDRAIGDGIGVRHHQHDAAAVLFVHHSDMR